MTKVTLWGHIPPQTLLSKNGYRCREWDTMPWKSSKKTCVKTRQNKALPTELDAFLLPGLGSFHHGSW